MAVRITQQTSTTYRDSKRTYIVHQARTQLVRFGQRLRFVSIYNEATNLLRFQAPVTANRARQREYWIGHAVIAAHVCSSTGTTIIDDRWAAASAQWHAPHSPCTFPFWRQTGKTDVERYINGFSFGWLNGGRGRGVVYYTRYDTILTWHGEWARMSSNAAPKRHETIINYCDVMRMGYWYEFDIYS